jgi:hypothetical protein
LPKLLQNKNSNDIWIYGSVRVVMNFAEFISRIERTGSCLRAKLKCSSTVPSMLMSWELGEDLAGLGPELKKNARLQRSKTKMTHETMIMVEK